MTPHADVSSLKAAGLAPGGRLERSSGSSTGGSVETWSLSKANEAGQTWEGQTTGSDAVPTGERPVRTNWTSIQAAVTGRLKGEGGLGRERRLRESGKREITGIWRRWVHGNPICGVTALITVGLRPPGAGAVGPERPALLAALSFLSRHWPSWGAALNVQTAASVPSRLYGPRPRPLQERAPRRLARVWSRRDSVQARGGGGSHVASKSLQIRSYS